MRTRLIRIVLKRTPAQLILPLAVIYVVLPSIGIMSYQSSGVSESQNLMIYAVQVFLPICSLLWPMAYMQMWVDDDCVETLISCNRRHKSCLGELLLLYLGYMTMLLLPFVAFCIVYGFVPLEYVRVGIQCLFATATLYAATQLLKNVTLGSLPIITYLFICVCFSWNPDFESLSIIKATAIYSFSELLKSYIPYAVSAVLLLCVFALLEKCHYAPVTKGR